MACQLNGILSISVLNVKSTMKNYAASILTMQPFITAKGFSVHFLCRVRFAASHLEIPCVFLGIN
jgi:hypothetical protein